MGTLHTHFHCLLLFLFFFLCFQVPFAASADCSFSDCGTCTQSPGCGWCSATQTCMEGNNSSPFNHSCIGSWRTTCIDCSKQLTCRGCLPNLDCAWCGNQCVSLPSVGSSICPIANSSCPCNEYGTCYECAAVAGCSFCDTGSCVETASQTCTSISCECKNFPTCTTCNEDPFCGWCPGFGNCSSLHENELQCGTIGDCDVSCNLHLSCGECTRHTGCGWCPSRDVCHSIDSIICDTNLLTQCPKQCGVISDCNLCVDMGLPCEWCATNKTCVDIGSSNCAATTDICVSEICTQATNCDNCLKTPGCSWCDDKKHGHCTDVFDSQCSSKQHTCSDKNKFSVGSFFGGIATMLGIYLVIGIAAHFYKKKFPPKNYSPLP